MSITEAARALVVLSAESFDDMASKIAVLRSVEATETAEWLREVAKELREACGEPNNKKGAAL